ncbi:uncharacterized protein LOC126668127 [Mercurialis annua]|uniref:uncharacterized protein LOC126668127 n=1 Tax=Mercurialis annua TaxID=3986 RepID=UPI002160D278|nr:uncharacterized protein LOC126668127 [Mercurialis annua]
MGNCIHRESSTQWGGDDWGSSPAPPSDNIEGQLLGDLNRDFTKSPSAATKTSNKEIKIKITKKQLEELLGRIDTEELSIEQVLGQLISVSNQSFNAHQRSWRPNLQSIPESMNFQKFNCDAKLSKEERHLGVQHLSSNRLIKTISYFIFLFL